MWIGPREGSKQDTCSQQSLFRPLLTFPLALSPTSFGGYRSHLFGLKNRHHAGTLHETIVYFKQLRFEQGCALTGSPHLWEEVSADSGCSSVTCVCNYSCAGTWPRPPFSIVSAALLGPACGGHTLFFTLWLLKERVLIPALRSISGENCNCLNVTFSGNSLNMR